MLSKKEEKQVRKAIDELEPIRELGKELPKIKIIVTPEYDKLIQKINELTELFNAFLETPDRFIKTS